MQVNPFPFKRSVRVEMIPLIDMFFLLLVFFIFGVFFMSMQQGLLVELPTATTAETTREEALTISVTAEGAIAVNREAVALPELSSVVRRLAWGKPETLVVVQADRKAAHGAVMAVLDAVRTAGLQRVSFQTDVEPSHAE